MCKRRADLKSASLVLEKWHQCSTELTTTFWASHDQHPWKGEAYKNPFVTAMAERMDQIYVLRMTHEELLNLLSEEEIQSLNLEDPFFAFRALNPLLYSPYTQPVWEAAVKEYERSLTPIEQHVVSNFRRKISSLSNRPQLLLREFQRFSNVLKRPKVRSLLAQEREILLSQLVEHIDSLERAYDQRGRDGSAGAGGRNLSDKVSAIVYARQLRGRVESITNVAGPLLQDMPSFDSFITSAEDLKDKLISQERQLFGSWNAEVEDLTADETLALQLKGRLMEINNAGILKVNYSERLVTLLREHRQLTELGYVVPEAVTKIVEEGEKYYRYGVMLKKVANFYNSMENQIIEEQKPMLLDALLAFEDVVENPNGGSKKAISGKNGGVHITWNNPTECQNYVDRLQKAADRLSLENRKLRKSHNTLGTEVVGLMTIDLLRSRDTWKGKWQGIKDLIQAFANKYPSERMNKWVLHWDQQVYKALEAGYQMGLESLNENLSEIKCELVFTNKTVGFKPPFEEIRMLYYRELKKFVSIPNAFDGLGNASVYRKMPGMNIQSLLCVYKKAEGLFRKLKELQESFREWTVLAMVDLDVFVEENVQEAADFDLNFKMIKAKKKDCEKLQDFEKVDCIRVSCSPFKSTVEDLLSRLSDSLIMNLKKQIMTNFKDVDTYLEQAMEKLSTRPHSIEEIGHAKKDWKEIESAKDGMRLLSQRLSEKKKMFLQYAPGSNIDTTDVTSKTANLDGEGGRWDSFEIALDAFNEMIEEQKESLKGVIEEEIINLNVTIDKLGQR